MNILTLDIWVALWSRLGTLANSKAVMSEYIRLCARYAEPHRAYHTFTHIEHCLREWQRVRVHFAHPDAALLALWYHDAVYDTKAKDNEEQSVTLMRETCAKFGQPEEFVRRVADLIMATKHLPTDLDDDARLLVDIDLSVLGFPQEKFETYEREIRIEYRWVKEDDFVRGRTTVLKSFLARPTIYNTCHFQHLEAQARKNLERSLHALQSTL